ncbi:MAG: Holliday junction resolvase RuvX [Odoribacter sp.]|nr:Holliday junction resolvase RuvX [Bacteroidales bacterium]MBR2981129.1 Holliday junction resolvase RuvX [Odoribacter sp.]
MNRVIGIDYGKKRVGVAVTDPCGIVATALGTVASNEIYKFLEEYFKREQVDTIVVGHPKQMDNSDSQSMTYITPFVKALTRKFPDKKIEMYDERFTSVLAHKALIEGGAKKHVRQDKALIDSMSAVIILNSWLESKKNF